MYCLKCKKVTDTTHLVETVSKNGRLMQQGVCAVCGQRKSKFIKQGGSLVNRVINQLPFEMHLPGHNFTGPGTKLDKRLNPDLSWKPWSKPVNRVDEAAYRHDLCYWKHRDTKARNEICDKNMIDELSAIPNPTTRESIERGLVKTVIGTKAKLGLGFKKT